MTCRTRRDIVSSVLSALLLGVVLVRPAFAQIPGFALPGQRNADENDESADDSLLRLHSDRRIAGQMERLSLIIRGQEMQELRDLLEQLQAADATLMVPGPSGTFVPLHRAVALEIRRLSPESRKAVTGDEAAAFSALLRAIQERDAASLVTMLHQHPGTDAAWKAHLLLAAMQLDRGDRRLAQYWLLPLTGRDAPSPWKEQAERLLSSAGPNESAIRDAASTAQQAPLKSEDLQVRWTHQQPVSPHALRRSRDFVQSSSQNPQERSIAWSAWEPMIDTDQIFVRTDSTITSVDRRTGRHLWTRTLLPQKSVPMFYNEDSPPAPGFRFQMPNLSVGLSPDLLMLHRNEIVGRMTADAQRLFAVCQISDGSSSPETASAFPQFQRRGESSAGLRELVAFEKSSGRRLWTMGGLPLEEQFGNDLAGCWFSGPPVSAGNELFGIIEQRQTLSLFCLAAETGEMLWKLPLVDPDPAIGLDPMRQLLSARTAAAGNMVVTTTSSGWVFAVDTLTKTVLWSRTLPAVRSGIGRLRSTRRSAAPPSQPISLVWRSEDPQIAADIVALACAESGRLLMLNLIDGRIRTESSADDATLVVYADTGLLVTASPRALNAWELPGLKIRWKSTRGNEAVVPIGKAVRRGNELLLPLADGTIEIISLDDGRTLQTLRGLRPAFSAGGLFSSGARQDIVSFGPDHMSLVSATNEPAENESDPLQKARFLVDVGRFDDAQMILSSIPEHALNRESLRQLKLRIAIANLLTEPGNSDHHKLISELARNPSEKALAVFLNLKLQQPQNSSDGFRQLLQSLTLDRDILSSMLPDDAVLMESLQLARAEDPLTLSTLKSGADTLHRPLRSWILLRLRERLDTAEADQLPELIRQLESLSDSDLLQLQSPLAVAECQRRAELAAQDMRLNETTLHLMMAALPADSAAASPAADGPSARISTLFDRLLAETTDKPDSVQTALNQQLLEVLRKEILSDTNTAGDPSHVDPFTAIADRFAKTAETTYAIVPVSTIPSYYRPQNKRHISPVSHDDLFLNAFHWSLRRDPSALIVSSVLKPELAEWSLRTSVSDHSYIQSDEDIYRLGSILLLHGQSGLSAFSVLERRWLWHRSLPRDVSRRFLPIMNRSFEDFRPGASQDQRCVCGSTERWVCLIGSGQLEVVDLLTGQTLWKMTGLASNARGIACDTAVLAFSHDERILVDPISGLPLTPTSKVRTLDPTTRIMAGSGQDIAIWNPGTLGERSIEWMDPLTAEIRQSIRLPDLSHAQFLDPETIAAFSKSDTVQLVNLRTRNSTRHSFASHDPQVPKLKPDSLCIAWDAVNYYIHDQPDQQILVRLTPFTFSSRVEPVRTQLRAVNRRSGQLSWILPTDDDALACVQNPTTPVILFVRGVGTPPAGAPAIPIPGPAQQSAQRYVLEGISRTTGKVLFSQALFAQSISPNLQLNSGSNGSLNLEAFGTRLRLMSRAASSAP
jgi:outer membrane protein assembly factor BamB